MKTRSIFTGALVLALMAIVAFAIAPDVTLSAMQAFASPDGVSGLLLATGPLASKMVEVQATGPIKHGDGDTVTEYAAGETFKVTMKQAKQLVDAGAVEEPKTKRGGKTDAEKEAETKAAEEEKIRLANEKADADRKAAADGKS